MRSFADRDTERLHNREHVRRFHAFERIALRRLVEIESATSLFDLRQPGLRLELLKGDRKGRHSVRINDQWRVCFVWRNGHAYDVEIIDYH